MWIFHRPAVLFGLWGVVGIGGGHPVRPYDFMVRALAPSVERMGVKLTADCQHRGFFPTGGWSHPCCSYLEFIHHPSTTHQL